MDHVRAGLAVHGRGDGCAQASCSSESLCLCCVGWLDRPVEQPSGGNGRGLLKCRAIRAVRVDDDEPGYPARILVVYGPDGEPPLLVERSIAAANDGGRWVFETRGKPFAFEDEKAYMRRTKKSRFTGEMLHNYLLALGVPADSDPEWTTAVMIERTP
jgi:hypothetical protein